MITDELREWWVRKFPIMDKELNRDFTAIANRIDAEHESKVGCTADEWDYWESTHIELPKDADGVPIRVGDVMEFEHRGEMLVAPVDTIELSRDREGYLWSIMVDHQCVRYSLGGLEMRHHKSPTVEDVLEEMYDALEDARIPNGSEKRTYEEIIAEYAAKLQLRGEGE